MPNFNIHWRGYPHRRLPRIRASSTRSTSGTSIRSRTIPRIVAANSIRRPLGAEFKRARKKQRFALRRRQSRKSRSSSSTARARKLVSLRARQHIQVFGWDADIASKANTVKTESVPSPIQARAGSRIPAPPTAPQDSISQTTIIGSHDGAGSSVCRRLKPPQPENLYSLMHVAQVPVYWSSKKSANQKNSSIASSQPLARLRRAGECTHVGPLDPVSRRSTYRRPRRVGRSRTYDPRIDPRSLIDRERPTKSVPTNPTATTRHTVSRPSAYKPSLGSPGLHRTLESKVSKETKASPQSVAPSMKSIVQTLISDSASRTPSQRKTLKRFTKELELYLQAVRALPKHSLVPSLSATTVSAHTIEELKPYQSEFRSAGLAITSADQRRESSIVAKLKIPPSPPPTPPKDRKYNERKSVAGKSKTGSGGDKKQEMAQPHHHHKTGSLPSFDSETTIMDFTPPHEQIDPRDARGRRRGSLSSDHTIMAFTPPHEVLPQPKPAPPPPPRASTKRSLPWLRKPETLENSPSPTTRDKDVMTASTVKAKTRNPSDVLLSFSVARSSAVEKRVDPPEESVPRELDRRDTEVKWQDMNYRTQNTPGDVTKKRKSYNDSAIQVALELLDDFALTDQGFHSADATTQTDVTDIGPPNDGRTKSVLHRLPIIKHKSKTFPTSPKKCAGECSESAPGSSGLRSLPKYKDQAIQSDILEKSPDINQVSAYESKRSSFKSNLQTPDLNCTFPFASPSPFQRPQAPRSPSKSVDEVAVRRSRARNEPLDTNMPAPKALSRLPTRPSQWHLRCTQCSAKICASTVQRPQQIISEARPEPEPEPQPEIEPQSSPRSRLSHTCTARSSLECQQCAPQDTGSPAPQREDIPPLFTRSPQQATQYSPHRASAQATDWAATLEADLEEVIKGYQSSEERFVECEIIADTVAWCSKRPAVADPVKRPSGPKLKLRPAPTTRALQKQSSPRQIDTLPSAPPSPDTVLPQSETITTSSSLTRDDAGISNRAVFRGLHVATAAACDEDIATWIEEITGTGVRRFLANLSAFDGLGVNTLAGVAKRAAKQRRGEVKAWERVREKRLQEREFEQGWKDCVLDEKKQGCCKDRRMGLMAIGETVNMKAERSAREKSCEVLDDMIKARGCRSREGLRERAVRMGWRDRSVSGDV